MIMNTKEIITKYSKPIREILRYILQVCPRIVELVQSIEPELPDNLPPEVSRRHFEYYRQRLLIALEVCRYETWRAAARGMGKSEQAVRKAVALVTYGETSAIMRGLLLQDREVFTSFIGRYGLQEWPHLIADLFDRLRSLETDGLAAETITLYAQVPEGIETIVKKVNELVADRKELRDRIYDACRVLRA